MRKITKPKRLTIWWNWRTTTGRARMICAFHAWEAWDSDPRECVV